MTRKDEDMLLVLRWKYLMAFITYLGIYNVYNFYSYWYPNKKLK